MVCYVTYVTYDGLRYVISTDKYFSSFADFPDVLVHFRGVITSTQSKAIKPLG